MPGLAPGPYFVLVETDSGGQVSDVNRANNVLASTSTLSEQFNSLPLGGSVPGLLPPGRTLLRKVDLPAGQDVQISVSAGVQNALTFTLAINRSQANRVFCDRRSQ